MNRIDEETAVGFHDCDGSGCDHAGPELRGSWQRIPQKVGGLSYLNITEADSVSLKRSLNGLAYMILYTNGVIQEDLLANPVHQYDDSLDAMLMALQAKQLDMIEVSYYTAKYLCANNDHLTIRGEFHPEKANAICQFALAALSDGYSFMLREENAALRDEINAQLKAMKEEGTLEKLIEEHIYQVADGGEPVRIAFDQFEGETIRVGVTGSLPPMDYVAADGTFAGFNTAVLAEIGRRLQKNIKLVQVDSLGRALALSKGKVDVVFWTRGTTNMIRAFESLSPEEQNAKLEEDKAMMTEEEKSLVASFEIPDAEHLTINRLKDIPEGTIITAACFEDLGAFVKLKERMEKSAGNPRMSDEKNGLLRQAVFFI